MDIPDLGYRDDHHGARLSVFASRRGEYSRVIGAVVGDIVGGNKGLDEERLVAALEARGHVQAAELAGLQRRTIISLVHRLKPDVRDFEHAVTELERAVEVALDVIARGERGKNDDAFVNAILVRVAAKIRSDDLDGGVSRIGWL